MSLISQPAPDFAIPAVSTDAPAPWTARLSDYADSWLLLLFYPRDFSFVCPTELTSFSARRAEFDKRNCQILGVSVDSVESHLEWLSTPLADGGLGPLQFPLGSDSKGAFAQQLGIWLPAEQVSTRGLFLIDPKGILQYGVVHNLSVGRNAEETLRVLDAMQSGGLCPASWTSADGTIDLERAIQPGRVVGHYRIKRLLGEGSSGSVFAAWDLHLERNVALKVLKRVTADSREATLREARTVAALNHPNVCAIYAIEEQDGLSLIVMEFVDGRSLAELIVDLLPSEVRIQIAHGIAAGLAAAHQMQIVHGDLKPANVLVARDLSPRILDFGLSRKISHRSGGEPSFSATLPFAPRKLPHPLELDATLIAPPEGTSGEADDQLISGTPAYMSPEQWSGLPATPASDIFAFGLIFFEIMTGHRALSAEILAELLTQLRDPQLPVTLSAELPLRFRALLISTLASEPSARPTAKALTQLLYE